MMIKKMSKLLSVMLLLGMLLSLVPAAAFAADGNATWEPVALADITADDVVAITMSKDGTTWALPSANTSGAPAAAVVTETDGKLTVSEADYGWTVSTVAYEGFADAGRRFTNAAGGMLYITANNNGVRIGTPTNTDWAAFAITDGYLTAVDSKNETRYVGVYMTNPDWRCYTNNTGNIAGQTLRFWRLVTIVAPVETEPPIETEAPVVTVAKPTADVPSGEVKAGTVVTFSCATEGAVISYSLDNDGIWTEGNTFTVNEDVSIQVKAALGEAESEIAEFSYTVKAEEPTPAAVTFVSTENPEDGDKVVIYYPKDSKVLGTEEFYYNNKKYEQVAVDATLTADGKLNVPDGAAILTVSVNEDEQLSFVNEDGKFLFTDGTDVKFVDEAGTYTLFVLEDTTSTNYAGGKFIKSANAQYNGKPQYIEYYNKYFTVYGMNTNNPDIYTFRFFKEETPDVPVTVATPTADVAAGEVEQGTVVTFSCATEGAVISYSTDNGETWTEGSTFTVNEDVTVQVKAVLGEVESEIASFTYTVKIPEPETVTIAEALAGETGAECTVKGVVALVDGRNIYIQDETGGIDLYFDTAPTDISLGDTLIGGGTRATYRGLPELSKATYQKSSGLTLEAKETTIGALTTADVCTYVKLSDLEVTEVFDNNGAYSNPNISLKDTEGNTIQIYKAVIEKAEGVWRVKVGDKVDVTLAVGINNKTLQLRNTLDSEITVKGDEPVTVETPTADVAAGEVEKGTVVTFSCATEGAVLFISTDNGETWTEGNTFTVNEDVTVQVKAVLGEIESAIASFAYTVKAEEPAADEGLVTDLAQLVDGATVVIYNPDSAKAMSSDVLGSDWYLAVADVTIEDNQAVNPAANLVWTVRVNEDGSYRFEQSDKAVTGWLSGNYVELTSNKSVSGGDSNWNINTCNTETNTYYIKSSTLANNYGSAYIEVFNKKVNGATQLVFCGYTTSEEKLTEAAYGMQFYLVKTEDVPPEPQDKGDLVTDLNELDGKTVAIYSPGHMTAISSKPNGDWYLKANTCTVENNKVQNFTADFVWTAKKNDDGTYSFYAYGDESRSITVWPSGKYAELSLNVATYPDNTWTLTPAKTEDCFYMNSPTVSGDRGPAYVEAYVRNETEVFSGYFTQPGNDNFKETEFALQFYLVDPADAVEAIDDGEWDGVLEKGKQYLAYNATAASSIGLFAEANYSMRAIPTEIVGDKAKAGNGAYAFTVDSMGRYYTFKVGDQYFATNSSEELLFVDANEDGSAPEEAKWYLTPKDGGYIIYNKEVTYNGTPVCVEYYSSVFSGWTFSTKNELGIYLFNFYEPTEDTRIYNNIVQDPRVIFDCEDSRFVEQDYDCSFSLDDLADEIETLTITYTAGAKSGTVTDFTQSADGKVVTFKLPAAEIDGDGASELVIRVDVKNSYGIEYSGEKTVEIIDKPFFTEPTPAPNAQTGDNLKPVISAKIGNVGEDPVFTMTVNGETVEAVFEDGVLSYTPAEDLTKGRATVVITVKRSDGVEAEKSWNFTVGKSEYQLYFGQLHSHTTFSDGSGSLDTALDYIASLPESANVQFVAFTDHSNYFDTTSASNPADALNDKSLMTESSRALWEEYKGKAAAFNESHPDLLALAGFEMTWSGGPGHINTFNSDGLVSRNNAQLNNKSGDAGMKLYYETINKGDSLNQFNHPGTTFGNFTDFAYWDEATDAHMFLVEVGNGEGQIGAGGYYPSYEQYTMALDKGWHVAPTNNQDNHKGRWGNANDARDVVLTDDFTEQGIYNAIRALRVYATEDKNLEIFYTINDQPMGTIFSEENAPEKLKVTVNLYDPDDSFSKVELIVDGGKTAYTWDNAEELASGELTAELEPQYSYYYVKVTQKDGDLAVTAPIWVGSTVKLGISDAKAAAEPVYIGEEATLVTTLFNNEDKAATVSSVIYTINGTEVLGTDTTGYSVPAGGTKDAEFKYTFTSAKHYVITVTAIFELDGETYEKTRTLELDVLDKDAGTATIAEVREASKPDDTGYIFTIEGVVTSNASGYDKDTAFFDCIYVQDDTAGICCFPVSGEYKIGDKVRIVGYTDFFQGEPELQVESIEVIGEGSVEPTGIKASELNDRSAEGKLVTVKGTVDSFELANGLIQTIMVKDAEGNLARVFIDGYITASKEVENCEVGAEVEATGLASYDDTWPDTNFFPRLRIRDRADVICTIPAPEQPQYRVVASDDVVVPEALKTKYDSVDAMKTAMMAPLKKATGIDSFRGDKLYELTVEVSTDGTTWQTVTAETFPKDGVLCTMPIPTGVPQEAEFYALHMFGEDCNGHKAGNAELPDVTKDGSTLSFTIKGMSPLLLAWTGDYILPDTPTANPESGKVEKGTVVTFSCETEGAVIMYSTDGGKTWTKGDSFTVTEDVTIQVKAVKDGAESEIASFSYTVKPVEPQYRVVVSDDAVVPEALKPRYASVDAMKSAMMATLKKATGIDSFHGDKLYELIVEVDDGSGWKPVTAANFPKEGVLCTMPIPTGASQDADFFALHMFGENCNGHKAGNAEMPAVTKDGSTLSFTIKGMSPLLLTWSGDDEPLPPQEGIVITLDANGGKVSRTRLNANADGSVPALPTPQERDGYIFGGWYDEKDGGEQVFEGDVLTESTTLYAHWFELRVTVTENAVVPEALKTKYASVDAMKTAMLNTVKRRLGTTTVKGNKLYELKVEYFDGSEWLPLDADLFPTKGVKVSLAIPSGSAETDRFVVLHLFGEDCNGHKAGEGEMPTITKSGSTLSFTVKGTSPLLLVWTGSSSGGNGKTPKTGDEANLGLWIALMAASSAAMAVLVIEQKKRKNRA